MVAATLTAPATTARFARLFAGLLQAPAVVTLQGDLGTGKTTLVRGVLRALGVAGEVTSPSFTLAQSYRGEGGLVLHHLDLYRLGPGADVELFAWDDYLSDDAIVFIEWPEAGAAELPAADVAVRLFHDRPTSRGLRVSAAPDVERALAAALREAGADDVRIDDGPDEDGRLDVRPDGDVPAVRRTDGDPSGAADGAEGRGRRP